MTRAQRIQAACETDKWLGVISLARKAHMSISEAMLGVIDALKAGLIEGDGKGKVEFYRRVQ